MTRTLRLGLLVLIPLAPVWGRSAGKKHFRDPGVEIVRHRARQARTATVQALRPEAVSADMPDQGDIAIVDDSGGVVKAAGFDLDQRNLEFRPAGTNAAQYTFASGALRFDEGAARGAALALGDDDAKEAPLPFPFPFYGQRYSSLWVHSDGNVTFGTAEASSDPRDFVRLVTGPPRIAAFFVDLDPSQPDAAVSYSGGADRFFVTWSNVPLYADAPGPSVPRETFQLILYLDGRIEVAYRSIVITQAAVGADQPLGVVGLAPGGATRIEQVTFADLSAGETNPIANAIVEEFSGSEEFDRLTLAQKFYRTHDDAYDYIVIFNTGTRQFTDCADAVAIKNWAYGIGLRAFGLADEFDGSGEAGSAGRLQTFVYMGPLGRYPDDPAALVAPGTACGRNSVLSILGQEAGHRFGAYIRFLDPDTNRPSNELLGRDAAHWSFYMNSDASFIEGNAIEDKGAGQSPRFATTGIVSQYGGFDRYLFGVRSAEETPGTFFVRRPSIDFPAGHAPQAGVLFDGARVDVTIPMVVAAEGPRRPPSSLSPKLFRFAFVLLVPAGATPAAAEIAKLERYRSAWETFFARAMDNLARAETRLVKQLKLSVWPAAGLIQGRSITATVSLKSPAAAPVTVALAVSGGQVSAPGSVTIPAGRQSAEFTLTANSPGIVELSARGPDDSYEQPRAFLNVRPSASGLRIDHLWNLALNLGVILRAPDFELTGAAGMPLPEEVIFRVRDENFLPYPGLRLVASPSGKGSVTPATLVTDARGWVRLRWTLDGAPGINNLTVALDGQSDVNSRAQAAGTVQPARRREVRLPVPPQQP